MKKIFIFLSLLIFVSGCRENPPVTHDGACELTVKAFYPNPDSLSAEKYLPAKNSRVILTSEYGTMIGYTDNNGILLIAGLPSAEYRYSVTQDHPTIKGFMITGTSSEIQLKTDMPFTDTIYTTLIRKSGLCINELYFSGPPKVNFWLFDQYIELYYAGDSIRYLDGMMLMRFSGNTSKPGESHKGMGADEGDDGDIDGATYIFKFPGNPGGKTIPVYPGTFITIALSAMDFTKFFSSSINLSNADWELYDQYSFTDTDNPATRNLINMRTDDSGEILFSAVNGVVILADGRDADWTDGIDISTVIDGVQYAQKGGTTPKTIDIRIDKSLAYAPSQSSGKSLQRRQPGLDTQDGTMDWEILNKPTPGRQ